MVRTKHQSPTEFEYPVKRICGKVSKNSPIVHACTASGKHITYLQGERNYTKHPITPEETAAKQLFTKRTKAAGARLNKKAETYAADLAAYRAQLETEGGYQTFSAYIWSIVKAQITE